MSDAKLRQKRVDGADLHDGPATAVAQFRGVDVILPIWNDERHG